MFRAKKPKKRVAVVELDKDSQKHEFLLHLDNVNFAKRLKSLSKKLKNKRVVFYGAGLFFETIKEHYDLSEINVLGIADKRFETDIDTKDFLGYKTYTPDEIAGLNPDYVVVCTLKFVNLLTFLSCDLLKDTKIKVVPLVKLPIFQLIKEIWNS